MELRFLELPRETKIGSRNREVRNLGGKITVKTSPRETTFATSFPGSGCNFWFEKSRVREIQVPLYLITCAFPVLPICHPSSIIKHFSVIPCAILLVRLCVVWSGVEVPEDSFQAR